MVCCNTSTRGYGISVCLSMPSFYWNKQRLHTSVDLGKEFFTEGFWRPVLDAELHLLEENRA